jgi:hypothetical protein
MFTFIDALYTFMAQKRYHFRITMQKIAIV